MTALSASKVFIKGSNISGRVPALSSLEYRELAINYTDGIIYAKTSDDKIIAFYNKSQSPLVFNSVLSAISPQFGGNNVTSEFGAILNGANNSVSGAGSVIVNGESNSIESDLSFIGGGADNMISLTADFGAILGGSSNKLDHINSFILGSNITSHAENYTYVNNLSVVGKIYGDGSSLTGITGGLGDGDISVNTLVRSSSASWDIVGDRYFTTSNTTNSINKGTKVFVVSTELSYIPTQDITIVYEHDISRHMHGTVLDYNSVTGSLTADITSRTGSGTYSIWRINIGGTPTFVDSLVASNNLSDLTSPSTALTNLSGVSKSELQSLTEKWQQITTTISSNSAINWNYQGTDLKSLSANWQNTSTVVQTNSAAWSVIRKFDMVYTPNTISYSGIAPSGSLTSQSTWTITRITYTTSGTVSAQGIVNNAIWDNRLSLSYV